MKITPEVAAVLVLSPLEIAIESTAIQSVKYDPITKTLTITFKERPQLRKPGPPKNRKPEKNRILIENRILKFSNVPSDVVVKLLSAESAGKYFNSNIKNKYQSIK